MTLRFLSTSLVIFVLLAWFAVGFHVQAEEGAAAGGGTAATSENATSTPDLPEEAGEEVEEDDNAPSTSSGQATTTPETTEEEGPDDTATSTRSTNVLQTNSVQATTTPQTATSTPDTATSTNPGSATTTPDETGSSGGGSPLDIQEDISLPNGCEVTDSDGALHTFPATSSPSEYLAICALVVAQEEGVISDFVVTNNESFGLFVESVEGIEGASAFWALWKNGEFADCGIACLVLEKGDTFSLIFTTFESEESDTITLTVSELEELFKNITLPNECEIEDKNGILHSFPTTSSPSEYLTVCALAAALEAGDIESFQLDEFSGFGLFVEGLNGVIAAADEFWSLFLNDEFAACGIECLPLTVGDIVSFVLTSFEGEERGADLALRVSALSEVSPGEEETPDEEEEEENDPGGGGPQSNSFDVPEAIAFLAAQQESDGSFGDPLFTDWAAIAFGSVSGGETESKLKEYLRNAEPSLSNITDYERHAMALMALNINPYSGTPVDYITPITEAYDGTQIGEASLVNDDIFAIFPLLKAGYDTGDDIIQKTVEFILSEQKSSGSWEGSIDLTAAAAQALVEVDDLADVSEALERAKTYLHSQQDNDGSFGGDTFSTSWAMQAIAAFGESDSLWSPNGDSPKDFLAEEQADDGGVLDDAESTETRVWATSYAIPAVRGKTWPSILSSFSKPETASESSDSGGSGGSGGGGSSSNNSQATSTATTTPQGLVLGESTTTAPETTPTAFSLPALSATLGSTQGNEDEATTSAATSSAQVAAAGGSVEGWSDLWTWSLGLLFIFFSLSYFYFFRNFS